MGGRREGGWTEGRLRRALRRASTARRHGGQRARRRLLLPHLPDLPLQLEHLLPQALVASAERVAAAALAPAGLGRGLRAVRQVVRAGEQRTGAVVAGRCRLRCLRGRRRALVRLEPLPGWSNAVESAALEAAGSST